MPPQNPPTPVRAASAAGRPKTRLWTRRLEASLTDAAERDRLREDAERYLSAADAARARGSQLSGADPDAPEQDGKENVDVAAGRELEQEQEQEQEQTQPEEEAQSARNGPGAKDALDADTLVAAFAPSSNWQVRVDAMKEFAAAPSAELADALASGIASALGDLRSQVVVAAADAAVAAAPHAPPAAAETVVTAGLDAAKKTKAVIADAGRKAVLAQLVAATGPEDGVWRLLLEVLQRSSITRQKACAIECFANEAAVKSLVGAKHGKGESIMGEAIAIAVVDRAAEVRDGGKAALGRLEEVCGKEEAGQVVANMPPDARARVIASKSDGDGGRPGASAPNKARPGHLASRRVGGNDKTGASAGTSGKPSFKDIIRQRRLEAQKAAREAATTGEIKDSAGSERLGEVSNITPGNVTCAAAVPQNLATTKTNGEEGAEAAKKRTDLELSPQKALAKRRNVVASEEKENRLTGDDIAR